MTVGTTAISMKRPDPPPPLVARKDNMALWAKQLLLILIVALVLASFCTFVVASWYYLGLEIDPGRKLWWHSLVPDSNLRHAYRDIGEGLLGGVLAQAVVWNHYKKALKARTWLDKLEILLRVPNLTDDRPISFSELFFGPFYLVLYAAVGFFPCYFLEQFLVAKHVGFMQPSTPHGSLFEETLASIVNNFPRKALGLVAAFMFGRRPAKPIFDDIQLWFAQVHAVSGRPVAAWHLPTYRARYNEEVILGTTKVEYKGPIFAVLTWASLKYRLFLPVAVGFVLAMFLGFAVHGWYVVTIIANRTA